MYLVQFDDNLNEESFQVLAMDHAELQNLLTYIEEKNYELISVHQHYIFIGLENFKTYEATELNSLEDDEE